MDRAIDQIIERHDQDLAAAYAQTMKGIRGELLSMREKLNLERKKRLADREKGTVSNEAQWFRLEAIKASEEGERMRQEITGLKMKVSRVEDERRFFERVAREAKRELAKVRQGLATSCKEPQAVEIKAIEGPRDDKSDRQSSSNQS